MALQCPADNLTGEQVHHRCQVQPHSADPDVGDVSHPLSVRPLRGEIPAQQVVIHIRHCLSGWPVFEAFTVPRPQAALAQQRRDMIQAARDALGIQLNG